MDGVVSELTITPVSGGLSLSGEIDGRTAPELKASVTRYLTSSSELRLDMANVTFMDSSGLRVLLAARMTARDDGGDLVLSNLSTAVVRVLRLSKLDGEFEVVDEPGDHPPSA
ncbi:MAG: STAS domain-containing protein [Actinomycetota bacterium]